jgi:RNA polymerase sigma-70 factor (ECF subfamily)
MFGRMAKIGRQRGAELLELEQSAYRREWHAADQAALPLLLQTHRAAVVHFLYRMVEDRAVAEELAVEVFSRLQRSTGRWSKPAAQRATRLFRIAAGLALEAQNERKESSPSGQDDAFAGVRGAMTGMPGRQRAAVVLHKYHQMDCGQIAHVLDCSESAAKSLLLSAYDLLRRRLARYEAPRTWDCTVAQ